MSQNQFTIEKIKLTDIQEADYNPRQISEMESEKLRNSISEFGLVDPIIVNLKNNTIIGGHQRYNAICDLAMIDGDFKQELNMIRLGNIGWVFLDTNMDIKDKNHEKALNLALNKISGEWDLIKLEALFDDLEVSGFDDIELTGFDGLEISQLKLENDMVYKSEDFSDGDIEDMYELPTFKMIECPNCGHKDEANKFHTFDSEEEINTSDYDELIYEEEEDE